MSRKEQLARLRSSLNQLYLPDPENASQNMERLLGCPAPLPGEAFSSWRSRVQNLLRIPTRALNSALGIDTPIGWADTELSTRQIERLAQIVAHTRVSLDPFTWPKGSLLSSPHYLCLTTTPLRRRPIFRYCEVCLRNDRTPYIRQLWRISCMYLCPKHGTILRELCPQCHHPYESPKYDQRHSTEQFRRCQSCRADLCNVESSSLPDKLRYFVLTRQAEILELIAGKSRLMRYWEDLEEQKSYRFGDEQSGIADMHDERNVRMLFARLLSQHLPQTKPFIGKERSTLDKYLVKVQINKREGKSSSVPVALDGQVVFGHHADEMCKHLIGRQDIWGGTLFWTDEYMQSTFDFSIFKPKDFADAAEWANKLASRARHRRRLPDQNT